MSIKEKEQKKERIKIDAPLDAVSSLFEEEDLAERVKKAVARNDYKIPMKQVGMAVDPTETVPEVEGPPNAFKRLSTALGQAPQMGDYQPSKFRRIAGAITGGAIGATQGAEAGFKTSSNIVQAPYREAYQDWVTRTGALEKEAELELKQQQLQTSGLSGMASLLRAQQAGDPELQANIAGAKAGAIAKEQEPYKIASFTREDDARKALESIKSDLRMSEEKLKQGNRIDITNKNIGARSAEAQKERDLREKLAMKAIASRENIAKLARELKQKMQPTRNQRLPPNQQFLAKIMAENEIATNLISDVSELKGLFRAMPTKEGGVVYQLKPESETEAKWKNLRLKKVEQVNTILKRILGGSFNPSAGVDEDDWMIESGEDGGDEFDENTPAVDPEDDDFNIEEID